jgi:hypothetical protein
LKNLFSIGTPEEKSDTLLLEVGHDYCCYAFYDQPGNTFNHIRYTTFPELQMEEELPALLNELKSQDFERILVTSGYAQAILVPQSLSGNSVLLNLLYDLPVHQYLEDAVPEWQLSTSYALPSSVFNVLSGQFTDCRFYHYFTQELKTFNGYTAADQIALNFSNSHFRVLVRLEQQVQLAQTYAYKTPLDVVYYLLKICHEFGMDQSTVFVVISGLVEQDSSLYKELHGYFLQLHFAQAPSFKLPETDLPHYYFTSLYNLAACAL